MTKKLDDIDLAIIAFLQQNGRLSNAEIARRIGNVTERVVRYRIEWMINRGIIRVSAIVDPAAVGYPVIADVWIEAESGHVLNVAKKLAEFDRIVYVSCSTGARDVSAQVVAHNVEEVYTYITETIGRLPGVVRTNIMLIPRVVKDVYSWFPPKEVSPAATGAKPANE